MVAGTKVAVITGASAGLGLEAARHLLRDGRRVIAVGRDVARCAAAEAELRSEGALTFLRVDLSLLQERAISLRGSPI